MPYKSNIHSEAYRSGHNEAVLKTVWGQPHGGSNPSASAKTKSTILHGAFCFDVGSTIKRIPTPKLALAKVQNPSASARKKTQNCKQFCVFFQLNPPTRNNSTNVDEILLRKVKERRI